MHYRQPYQGGFSMDLLYTIPAAVGLGALHSLEPGHGKGVITAYLVSSRARIRDAVLLGFISAIAHTLSIVLLAFAGSAAVKFVVPGQLMHWIELLSGLAVTAVGSRILYQQINPRVVVVGTIAHQHTDECDHHHHTHRGHVHAAPSSPYRLFIVGFFTGLIPCPSALAILLAAISEDRIPSGMGLVAAFSAGSAIAMMAIGALVVKTGDSIKKLEKQRVVQLMTLYSSLLILGIGVFVMYKAVQHLSSLYGA
jgi:ABC-type nickel/cobalt efflux system permease component RcnA